MVRFKKYGLIAFKMTIDFVLSAVNVCLRPGESTHSHQEWDKHLDAKFNGKFTK